MTSATRAMALSLAMLAMVLRGFVPVGWMPDTNGSGTMVICPGQMPSMPMPMPVHKGGHPMPDHGDNICPFAAAAAHHSPPLDIAVSFLPAQTGLRVAPDATAERDSARRLYASQSPRAPPFLA